MPVSLPVFLFKFFSQFEILLNQDWQPGRTEQACAPFIRNYWTRTATSLTKSFGQLGSRILKKASGRQKLGEKAGFCRKFKALTHLENYGFHSGMGQVSSIAALRLLACQSSARLQIANTLSFTGFGSQCLDGFIRQEQGNAVFRRSWSRRECLKCFPQFWG